MVERRGSDSSVRRAPTGWWHKPSLLNLISDALLLFAAAGLGWALMSWTLFSRPLFPLRELVLSAPPAQVTQEQLEYVARTAIRGNFFTARISDIRLAFEKLPWVRHAEVRRLWPNGLELSLEEHEAVAYWKNIGDGDVRLINRLGEVFVASSDAVMPEFSGPQGSAAIMLERYRAYSRTLKPLRAKLVRMELSARGAWRLWLDNGLSIVLDREERSPARLEDFVAAWPQLQGRLGGVQVAQVDLRYPNGFALIPVDQNTARPAPTDRKDIK